MSLKTGKPMICIVVRKTVNWDNEQAFWNQIPDEMRTGVELWNTTFNIPYHLYRSELKSIAQLNLSRIANAKCVKHQDLPPGAIAVPVDDDDWFAPDLALTLEKEICGLSGYYWPSRFLERPMSFIHRLSLLRRTLFPKTPPYWLCATNNYAIVINPGNPDTLDLLNNHTRATAWFLDHPEQVAKIDRPLSLMNRTLASTTQLRSRPSRSLLLRKYRSYARLYRKPVPPESAWCKPYVAMVNDLHARLQPI